MNSPDPWRVMLSSPPGDSMILPEPFYGNPLFGDTTHGRTFVGAEVPPPSPPDQRRGPLTATVAPIFAPAAGGYMAKLVLDDNQILHGAICVDGKCYEASIDLAPAIMVIMAKFAQYHADLHAAMPGHGGVPSTVVVGAIETAVGAAGDALVESLVDRHVTVACGNFLDDIGNVVKGIPVVGDAFKMVGETVKQLSGPIKAAAPMVATALGGPAAGAAASQFVGPIIDSLAGGKDTPAKVAAEQQAKVDPTTAAALAHAKETAAHTIAAYHTAHTARKAARGHRGAQRDINRLVQDAERGDPAAHAATPILSNAFMTEIANRVTAALESGAGAGTADAVSGVVGAWPWYSVVG